MDKIQDSLYKWYQECLESGDFSESLFEAKGIALMNEFGGPSTSQGQQELLRKYLKHFESRQKSTKSRTSFENLQRDTDRNLSLAQETDETKQKLDAEKFIREFNHQLEEKNIRRDNIYTMIKISFKLKPYFECMDQDKDEIDVEKLRNNRLFIMFCTNATGSHKLSPFYIYKYEDKKVKKYLKNKKDIFIIKNTSKNEAIFANWYNFFIKLVKEHQQKTNTSGKVLLLIKNCKQYIFSEDAMQNDNFEILFFPLGTSKILQPLKLLKQEIKYKFCKTLEDFYISYDMGICIRTICKLWANIFPMDIESLWRKLLKSDSLIEENPTSLIEQTSKLIKNVTKEDTICKQPSANRDEILDSLFSKVLENCTNLPISRETENATSTCIEKQTSELTENVIEEDIAPEETSTEINEKIQFLFTKLNFLMSCRTGNARSTSMVKQLSESTESVTDDIALEETSTEIEAEIIEQQNIEIKSDNFMELIEQHVKLRDMLRAAVYSVMVNKKSISDVTEKYELDIEILQLKIDILKDRRRYLQRKIKYETAIKDIISEERSEYDAIRYYKINKAVLCKEMIRRKRLGEKYTFDRKVMSKNQVCFTFQTEQLLLEFLDTWANRQQEQISCCCSICALKFLSVLVYKFVEKIDLQYPKVWDIHERVDIFWLREFEMRYSNDILILLYRSAYKRDSKKIMSDEQQLLYLFDKYMNYNF